ncbi:protein adenylyltransferase SelO family protein [Novosphingopyxis sp.]|uniref:protein adenylyltransferase SelO family protein n=1 Tax=Novosphingopyxis sp. TaxID=2709690 RepID=UPI003B5CC2D8
MVKIASLGKAIGDPVAAANFPETVLRLRNDRWAAAVGLDGLSGETWLRHFGRFEPLPDNLPQPLALRYHGHQFRVYNPEIGDGRGFLFAQLLDGADRLLDLATKGSGTTPYSRRGDGRLTLKGGVREILATEMLEALGVETSKSFSLIETGEALHRGDEPSPTRSAVLVRLGHGHIRIGTFQRAAFERNGDFIRELTSYCLDNFYGAPETDDPGAELMERATQACARQAAHMVVAGFVHGVLNSDNINVTGESFDYGPWRFTPQWQPGFTAAYFDEGGLYSFGRQAEAIHWNLAQLAGCLTLIGESTPLKAAFDRFADHYRDAFVEQFLWRLGFAPRGLEQDMPLIEAAQQALTQSGAGLDRFFFDWMGRPGLDDPAYAGADFAGFRERAAAYEPARGRNHAYWWGGSPCSMHIEEVEAIWARIAEDDDWAPLYGKVDAIRAMSAAYRG